MRAYDVRPASGSGYSTPSRRKGEPGYETWQNGSADYTGNTGVWTQITVDPEAGLAYLPVESPTSRFLWRQAARATICTPTAWWRWT